MKKIFFIATMLLLAISFSAFAQNTEEKTDTVPTVKIKPWTEVAPVIMPMTTYSSGKYLRRLELARDLAILLYLESQYQKSPLCNRPCCKRERR